MLDLVLENEAAYVGSIAFNICFAAQKAVVQLQIIHLIFQFGFIKRKAGYFTCKGCNEVAGFFVEAGLRVFVVESESSFFHWNLQMCGIIFRVHGYSLAGGEDPSRHREGKIQVYVQE